MRGKKLLVALLMVMLLVFAGTSSASAQVIESYTVAPGDTLYNIATQFSSSVSAIYYANNLSSDAIYPGQNLLIPVSGSHGAYYAVQPGDTLYLIGNYFGLTPDELAQANGISTGTVLYPGKVLNIPAGATSIPYTVVSGDTLYTIAQTFGTTVAQIESYNNVNGSSISPGQMLVVPTPMLSVYTVKPGDTLYTIGMQYNTGTYSLQCLNNLESSVIYPDENIFVPTSVAQTGGGISYTASDLDLLARLITAEADGEPFAAQVAVGAVVVNRVKSPIFPDTISSVIYQIDPVTGAYQFTPVLNGWINNPASSSSIIAAKDALAGQDPTHGALYYFNSNEDNAWLQSLPEAAVIGDLKFSY